MKSSTSKTGLSQNILSKLRGNAKRFSSTQFSFAFPPLIICEFHDFFEFYQMRQNCNLLLFINLLNPEHT